MSKGNRAKIGLGLAALGRPGYINLGHDHDLGEDKSVDALRANAFDVLDAAWAGGICYLDAARSYGRAEAFLAAWLRERELGPGDTTVASKWGYTYTAGWQVEAEEHEVKEHSVAVLQRQIKESRALLGGHLQLYQIHSATASSGVMTNEAVLDELARLKAAGLQIGFSASGPDQSDTIEAALAIERNGALLFDAVQATWNLLEPTAGPALAAAHGAGLRVIVKEALANGRLTARNRAPGFDEQRAVLQGIAAELESGIDALALAATRAQPWANVVLSGAATVEHLQSNLKSATLALSKDHLDRLACLAEQPQEYWQRRKQLEWN